MSKWFEVEVRYRKVYAVEVADNEGQEKAEDLVAGEIDDFYDIQTDQVTDPQDIESLKGYATKVWPLKDKA